MTKKRCSWPTSKTALQHNCLTDGVADGGLNGAATGVRRPTATPLALIRFFGQAVQLLQCCADARKMVGREGSDEMKWQQRVLDARGWVLERRASSMGEASGDGVFVRGSVPIGGVVSLYAGLVYRNTQEFLQTYDAEAGSEYLMARWDGGVIDGASGAPWNS